MGDRYYLAAESGLIDAGYKICDRQGREQEPMARVKDPEDGRYLVDLLNAAERDKVARQELAAWVNDYR